MDVPGGKTNFLSLAGLNLGPTRLQPSHYIDWATQTPATAAGTTITTTVTTITTTATTTTTNNNNNAYVQYVCYQQRPHLN